MRPRWPCRAVHSPTRSCRGSLALLCSAVVRSAPVGPAVVCPTPLGPAVLCSAPLGPAVVCSRALRPAMVCPTRLGHFLVVHCLPLPRCAVFCPLLSPAVLGPTLLGLAVWCTATGVVPCCVQPRWALMCCAQLCWAVPYCAQPCWVLPCAVWLRWPCCAVPHPAASCVVCPTSLGPAVV
jgi:hypothetical protein